MPLKSWITHGYVDEGLRLYFLKVYNYMVGGLVLTGSTAYVISRSPSLFILFLFLLRLRGRKQ